MGVVNENKAKEDGKKAVEWLASPEGSAALSKVFEKCRLAIKKRKKAREISWEDLHRPCTI